VISLLEREGVTHPSSIVLDVGCGPGTHAIHLVRRGKKVVGLDIKMNDSELARAVLQQRQRLREMAQGYRVAQILFACVELGVFEAIAAGARSATDVATAIQADVRGAELLLNAAVAIGLLEKREKHFVNMPIAETCLTRGGQGYIADSLKLESAFYRRWEYLTAAVKSGQRPEENVRDEQAGDWVRHFERALYNMARPMAPFIVDALALPEDRALRVLDVGGGHGGYSIALARRYPRLSATVFELPRVVPVTREFVAQAGVAERVSVQAGDFQHDDLGHGYDVALVFGVLNGEPPEGRPALIAKVFAALKPGGRIVLRDSVLDADRASPPEAAIFALQMLLATDAGGLDTRDEWTRWLIEAGFAPPQSISLPAWIGSELMVADKPRSP
jgi:cyclopropane fatty-acyl-phospholipid synthase-like methyltransferase